MDAKVIPFVITITVDEDCQFDMVVTNQDGTLTHVDDVLGVLEAILETLEDDAPVVIH